MDDATRLEVFRQSLLSRRLEERIMSLAKAGEVPASLHMGAGKKSRRSRRSPRCVRTTRCSTAIAVSVIGSRAASSPK
jgi:hypothetical protein